MKTDLELQLWLAGQLSEEIGVNYAVGSFNKGRRVTFYWDTPACHTLVTLRE